MSNTYTLPLTPGQVRSYTDAGLDYTSGFAVDAEAIEDLTDPADLIELFQIGFEGGPFTPDQPLYVLDLVAGPLVHARKAVGPLQPGAFLGGIFEVIPFSGNGIARAGGVETDLLWLEPARVTAGSQIWKFESGKEPEMVAAYHGIAYGWETRDGFKAIVPSTFLGTVIKRSWGEIPCDVELDNDGAPEAITLVAPGNPEGEDGFEQIESGLWAKRIAYSPEMQIYESQKIAKIDGVPSRVLRPLRQDGELRVEAQALLPDAIYTRARGFVRFAPGVFIKGVPLEGLKAQSRTATPRTWTVESISAVRPQGDQTDINNPKELIPEIFKLVTNAAPDGFQTVVLTLQVVSQHVVFSCEATKADGTRENIESLPSAIVPYVRQLKKLTADPDEGAFFLAKFTFAANGTANFGFNRSDQPMWAGQVAPEQWRADVEEFPRSGAHTPDWLIDAIAGKLHTKRGSTTGEQS